MRQDWGINWGRAAFKAAAFSCQESFILALSNLALFQYLMHRFIRDFGHRRLSSTKDLYIIVLDHCVRQQLLGGILQFGLNAGAVAVGNLDVKYLALAHTRDAVDAERSQRTLDRLALGIENAGFQRHSDLSFHGTLRRPVDNGESGKPQPSVSLRSKSTTYPVL